MSNIKIRTRPSTADHLLRPRPHDDGPFQRWVGDDNRFFVYVHVEVLEFIRNEARRAMPDETIGLLAGRVCEDPQTGPYTMIVAAENARVGEFEASPSHVRLRGPGQAKVRRRLEDAHPDREIVGWYHTHPGYTSHFSGVDIDEQKTWSDRNHIGIVCSTSDREEFGVYRSSDSIRLRPVESHRIPVPRPNPPPPPEILPPLVQLRTATPVSPPNQSSPSPLLSAPVPPPHELPESKNNVLTRTPAALISRVYIVVLSIMAIVILGQMVYLFRLDRRVSFNEGRLHEVSATRDVLEKIAERLAAQQSATPAPAKTPLSAEADGPEFRLPAKSLKPETPTRDHDASSRRRAVTGTQPRKPQNTKDNKRTEKMAQKPDSDKSGKKPPATPANGEPKPERTPQ